MAENNVNVIGILIGNSPKDYKLKEVRSQFPGPFAFPGTYAEGMGILSHLDALIKKDTQLIVVYDVSCENKEKIIKHVLSQLDKRNKKNPLPMLIAIGVEPSSLISDVFKGKVSCFKQVTKSDMDLGLLFQTIISDEADNLIKLKDDVTLSSTDNTGMSHISMMVLGGFIAAAGIVAVAIAFTALNAALLGAPGIVLAVVGTVALLSGAGLFGVSAYRNKQNSDGSMELAKPQLTA